MTRAPGSGPRPVRRGLVLLTLSLSVVLVSMDNMIVNVALPTLGREFGASTSGLQWVVDGYTVAFAGLLLVGGHLGDRLGRRRVLQTGLGLFGAACLVATRCGSAESLTAARVGMGVAAALVYPSTLAILTDVFRERGQRAMAIGVWSGVSGAGIALGPVLGGVLLEHYSWGSVFVVNVPVVLLALVLGRLALPESRGSAGGVRTFDLGGAVLSAVGILVLVHTIIEAPTHGWTAGRTVAGLAVAVAVLAAFVGWELRHQHPLFDVRLMANPRISAAAAGISMAHFALFGFIFVITLYFQLLRGWGPLRSGAATLPYAGVMGALSPVAMAIGRRLGGKVVVGGGMLLMSAGLVLAAGAGTDASYWGVVVPVMVLMAAGMALAVGPATDAIMAAVPRDAAGAGSALNDATREVGGALGVAVVGSTMSSVFAARLTTGWTDLGIAGTVVDGARHSVGAALSTVASLPGEVAADALRAARESFMAGMHAGSWVAAAVTALAAAMALLLLPARDTRSGAGDVGAAAGSGEDPADATVPTFTPAPS